MDSNTDGWKYDYNFLYHLARKVNHSLASSLSMEEIEAVLIAVEYKLVGNNERLEEVFEIMDKFAVLNNNSNGWISCAERLPENDDYVLAFERGRIGISYYRNAVGGWGGKDLYCTHWQPLPSPPIQQPKI